MILFGMISVCVEVQVLSGCTMVEKEVAVVVEAAGVSTEVESSTLVWAFVETLVKRVFAEIVEASSVEVL
jgi:hypothetical protein